MTDWVTVQRKTRSKSGKTVQIIVKVGGSKTCQMDVSLRDKVGDTARRVPSSACCSQRDVYLTCDGRVLRRSEELTSCGVSDGSTLQVTSRMRGGGKHEDTKSKAEKKRAASPERQPKSDKGQASQERGKEESLEELRSSMSENVVQQVLETGLGAIGGAEALERLSEGSDDEVGKTMKLFLVEFKKACR